MPRAGFEAAQNLSSGFVDQSCTVVITTTPRYRLIYLYIKHTEMFYGVTKNFVNIICQIFSFSYDFNYKDG